MIELTAEQNNVKNKVLQHINMSYNIDKIGMDIITDVIDSVFYFQNKVLEGPSE